MGGVDNGQQEGRFFFFPFHSNFQSIYKHTKLLKLLQQECRQVPWVWNVTFVFSNLAVATRNS